MRRRLQLMLYVGGYIVSVLAAIALKWQGEANIQDWMSRRAGVTYSGTAAGYAVLLLAVTVTFFIATIGAEVVDEDKAG